MYLSILDRMVKEYSVQGDEANLKCPVHLSRTGKEDSRPSFYFNLETGLCICFSCGYRGNASMLWRELTGDELDMESVEDNSPGLLLRARLDRALRPPEPLTRMDEAELLMLDEPTDEMLATRGISREACTDLGIRSMGNAWVLPIRDMSGMLMGYQHKEGKLVRNHPRGIRKSMSLFGLELATGPEELVVVESPLDVAVCRTHGIQAVATYGTAVSQEQIEIINGFPRVVLAMDSDEPGQDASKMLMAALTCDTRVADWPSGMKDPGDAGPRIVEIVEGARSPLYMRLRKLI